MKIINKNRCSWCGDDPIYIQYHDEEWGVPIFDDKKIFELLLETLQAGISWVNILKKEGLSLWVQKLHMPIFKL